MVSWPILVLHLKKKPSFNSVSNPHFSAETRVQSGESKAAYLGGMLRLDRDHGPRPDHGPGHDPDLGLFL